MTKSPFLAHRAAPALLAAMLVLAGSGAHGMDGEPGDPLEPVNRVSHRIGLFLDRVLLGPVARAYVAVTPGPVRTGVSNFVDNLTYPSVILNDFLQGKFEQGMKDSARFVFNTTFGLGGFIDFASGVGLERHDEDLGQTLQAWGVGEIAYLDLPVLGPSSVRDVGNIPLAWQTSLFALANVSGLAVPVAILGAVNARAEASELIAFRDRVALDTYVFTRESYRRRRNHLFLDGEAADEEDNLFLDDEASKEDDDFAIPRSRRQEHLLSVLDPSGSMEPGEWQLDRFSR